MNNQFNNRSYNISIIKYLVCFVCLFVRSFVLVFFACCLFLSLLFVLDLLHLPFVVSFVRLTTDIRYIIRLALPVLRYFFFRRTVCCPLFVLVLVVLLVFVLCGWLAGFRCHTHNQIHCCFMFRPAVFCPLLFRFQTCSTFPLLFGFYAYCPLLSFINCKTVSFAFAFQSCLVTPPLVVWCSDHGTPSSAVSFRPSASLLPVRCFDFLSRPEDNQVGPADRCYYRNWKIR